MGSVRPTVPVSNRRKPKGNPEVDACPLPRSAGRGEQRSVGFHPAVPSQTRHAARRHRPQLPVLTPVSVSLNSFASSKPPPVRFWLTSRAPHRAKQCKFWGRNGSFSASVGLPAGSGRLRSAPGLLTRGWLCSAAARRRFAESAVHCRLQTVVELFFFLSLNTVSDSWLPCSH